MHVRYFHNLMMMMTMVCFCNIDNATIQFNNLDLPAKRGRKRIDKVELMSGRTKNDRFKQLDNILAEHTGGVLYRSWLIGVP